MLSFPFQKGNAAGRDQCPVRGLDGASRPESLCLAARLLPMQSGRLGGDLFSAETLRLRRGEFMTEMASRPNDFCS